MAGEVVRIVGIGTAGGSERSVRAFLEGAAAGRGVAYVVVGRALVDPIAALARDAAFPIEPITDGVAPVADRVYVAPPDVDVVIGDGQLRLVAPEPGERAPVDRFFRSLARANPRDAVAVILSGAGADGSLGVKRMREHGGLTAAEDPEQAARADMPRAAIATGCVDLVAPAGLLLARVLAVVAHGDRVPRDREPVRDDDAPRATDANLESLQEILALVRIRTGHDFGNYKRATLLRRVSRRMQVSQTNDLGAYLELVREHPAELAALQGDFLISVTNFFRDHDAFRALEQLVVPKIFDGKDAAAQVRVWVPGCATGEEAYSIAILLAEEASRRERPPAIQLFATDIDDDALAEARAGRYPTTISADLSPERLERWFIQEASSYVVHKRIREMVLFSAHNVLRDPPFSKLDLISCRNLLIYLNREAQDRTLGVLHFGLRPDGFLLLGSSESAEHAALLFAPIDAKHRVYARRATSPAVSMAAVMPSARWTGPQPIVSDRGRFGELHHRLVELYGPPSVLVNDELDIVHVSERAGRFLSVGGGEPSRNLLRVVHPGLRLELRAAIYAARQPGHTTETRSVRIEEGGVDRIVRVTVRTFELAELASRMLLVLFEEHEAEPRSPAPEHAPATIEPIVRQLEDELHRTRDQLRATVEQYETSVEELKASNEELHAINEELRSASEELETSKEELQIVNQELTALNGELKDKIDEVSRANSDLQNLMTSTDIAVLFLDRGLDIKRFTPRAQDLFNVIASDVGRPFSHLTHRLEVDDLAASAAQVLANLRPIEREVGCKDGSRYLARIHPYRSVEDRIDGVVLTFLNVTELEAAQDALRARETLLRLAERAAGAGSWELDVATGTMLLSDEYRRLHDFPVGTSVRLEQMFERVHEADRAHVQQAFRRAIADHQDLNLEHRLHVPGKGVRWMWKTGKMIGDGGGPQRLAGITIDVTERRLVDAALRASEERFRLALRTAPVVMLNQDQDLRYTWGYMAGGAIDFVGKRDDDLFPPAEAARLTELKRMVLDTGVGRRAEVTLTIASRTHYYDLNLEPILGERGALTGVSCAAVDVTSSKEAELALLDADRRKDEFLATLAHELRNPLAPLVATVDILRVSGQSQVRVERALDVMQRQVAQLVRLVDDLLDVARITQGKIHLRIGRHRINAIVDAALDATRHLFEAAHHQLDVVVPPLLEVECDDLRMTQILTNLLSNAAKYTPAGGSVFLTATAVDGELRVRVRDSGIGITPETLPRVFDLFVQGDAPWKGGLGIGLNIVRRLVQLHGGEVEAHSEGPGTGSEFVVRVPIAQGHVTPRREFPAIAAPSRRLRVLVVDDNRDVSATLADLVRMIGHDVHIANDGPTALVTAEQLRPDVVLLDIGMPGMTGHEVARRLRERFGGRALLLVAITGWGQPHDLARSRESGFDHHLVKPAGLASLRALLGDPHLDAG